MGTSTPLQILLFRLTADEEVHPYEQAIVRAFQGGKEPGAYLATGADLGIELRVFETAPPTAVDETLDCCCHTMTVLLADRQLFEKGGDALWDWIAECAMRTDDSHERHGMVVLTLEERAMRDVVRKRPDLGRLQIVSAPALGEAAVRPALFALYLLHVCRVLLAKALPEFSGAAKPGFLRLFISHAKLDGLPLAHALKHQIETLKWLEDFYDADDLPPGCNWQKELENGVGSSVIVMLRTDIYDSRYWCQREVFWADEYATPAVLVDARTGLDYPAGVLPFDRVPSVRIPDGNLLRVLFLSLREGLRFLHFKRRVEEMKAGGELSTPLELRVFSFPPSMAALLRACRSFTSPEAADVNRIILYPDPVLRTGTYEAAHALVAAYAPSARLVTPDTLAATRGVTA